MENSPPSSPILASSPTFQTIPSPTEIKTKIDQQKNRDLNKEIKGLSPNKLIPLIQQYFTSQIIKKRRLPPYKIRLMIIYHDLPESDLKTSMSKMAQVLEQSDWCVLLKFERITNPVDSPIKIRLCDDFLQEKYALFTFHLHEKMPSDWSISESLYRTKITPNSKTEKNKKKLGAKIFNRQKFTPVHPSREPFY